ncbi:MAG: trk/ktr system potassium uptake protein [Thermoanaerobacterium sp.]|uniref:Trk system potassium uptake protein TrkA n=1 Tax=Thermoanaerobacterium butyriciformans TaxID=1702242 RepID=A0ABS4NAF6_9THEO|nr:TrkA family potassium uptake protein [Thermoanaerobacterium butyriciformans]MBP2070652.1 trk system potassium uptake protein TrkA [Thermoanaerobacterium butyriciformans]MDI3477464.1 trk/ktr system potassium uptake protein [Thermoanaerobacterium sp.]MDN5316774.1 trk/ktr system potassium uptake protein [Thermoanaerobacterium sp.]
MSGKQFVVIGLGRFGSSVAMTLYSLGCDVLAIDSSEERVQRISDSVTRAVQADATDEKVLRSLGVRNFDVAIIGTGTDIQTSLMVTLMVKELGVKTVVAKALNELHAKVLLKIGADRVIFPEKEAGIKLAHSLTSSNILDFIELSPEYNIVEIMALRDWIGKSLNELKLRQRFGLNIIAIKRENNIKITPSADDIIMEGDNLFIIASIDSINKLNNS